MGGSMIVGGGEPRPGEMVTDGRMRRADPEMDPVLRELRRPFAPTAVKWKIQTAVNSNRAGIVVAHIDARLVLERLNLVVGVDWHDEYDEFAGAMRCRLTVEMESGPVTRQDVGIGADPKSRVSDALKRAAVKFGIGVSVYAMASVYMEVGAGQTKLGTRKKWDKQQNKFIDVPDLTAQNRLWLAEGYERWLDTPRGGQFGAPLEHGDEADAQGLDDEGAPRDLPEVERESPEAEDAREAALRAAREAKR